MPWKIPQENTKFPNFSMKSWNYGGPNVLFQISKGHNVKMTYNRPVENFNSYNNFTSISSNFNELEITYLVLMIMEYIKSNKFFLSIKIN